MEKVGNDGTIGLVIYRVPKLDYILFYVHGTLGRLLLVVLPALLLGGYEIWRIWSPGRDAPMEKDDEATV